MAVALVVRWFVWGVWRAIWVRASSEEEEDVVLGGGVKEVSFERCGW